jgi:hypothetical protein
MKDLFWLMVSEDSAHHSQCVSGPVVRQNLKVAGVSRVGCCSPHSGQEAEQSEEGAKVRYSPPPRTFSQ